MNSVRQTKLNLFVAATLFVTSLVLATPAFSGYYYCDGATLYYCSTWGNYCVCQVVGICI